MESKILNFVDAMKLAKIISKYVSIPIEINFKFLEDLLNKILPEEYLEIILLLGCDYKNLDKVSLIREVVKGLTINNTSSLLKFYSENM